MNINIKPPERRWPTKGKNNNNFLPWSDKGPKNNNISCLEKKLLWELFRKSFRKDLYNEQKLK